MILCLLPTVPKPRYTAYQTLPRPADPLPEKVVDIYGGISGGAGVTANSTHNNGPLFTDRTITALGMAAAGFPPERIHVP